MRQEWRTLQVFLEDCKGLQLSPILRLLLSSDGSTTRSFKSLFLRPITLELIHQKEVLIDEVLSSQLRLPKGDKGIERAVWLKTLRDADSEPTQKLLYAVSTFPVSGFAPALSQALQLGQKPLGQIIDERGLATYRDSFEIACLPFPQVASELRLEEETLFWARRYRLSIATQVSAHIFEVFSPALSSFSS